MWMVPREVSDNTIRPCHKAAILPGGGPKKLCFPMLSLIPMVSIVRLSVVKQRSFGLPGQYGRCVTRVNCDIILKYCIVKILT